MRKGEISKKAERLTASIIFFSIVGLFLLSILPWISIAENDSVKEDLNLNFEMMTKSSNNQILDLASDLNLINISFWALIILGLLTFLGATIHASGIFSIIGQAMLLIGCANLVLSILIIKIQIDVLGKIEGITTISVASIHPPFNYAYIVLAPSLLIMIFSAFYAWNMSLHSIQKFKDSIKGRKNNKEEKKKAIKFIKKIEKTKEEQTLEKKESAKPEIDKERVNMEQWLTGEVENLEKQDIKEKIPEPEKEEEPEQPAVEEEQVDIEEEDQEEAIQDEEETTPAEPLDGPPEKHIFQHKKTKEKTEKSDEVPLAQSFEKALSSAIKKKQTEIDDLEPLPADGKEEKKKPKDASEKKETSKQKISVRCPQCKHIFTFEKQVGATKIKCPECGKEGVVK